MTYSLHGGWNTPGNVSTYSMRAKSGTESTMMKGVINGMVAGYILDGA